MSVEDKRKISEMTIPQYFDRYVDSEFKAMGDRFDEVNRRISEHRDENRKRFDEVNSRIDKARDENRRDLMLLRDDMDRKFDGIYQLLKWSIGLIAPLVIGMLLILFKQFVG